MNSHNSPTIQFQLLAAECFSGIEIIQLHRELEAWVAEPMHAMHRVCVCGPPCEPQCKK